MISLYPQHPGSRGGETSEAAAKLAEKNADVTREQILSLLLTADLTADELAAIIRKDVHNIRSRCSELKAGGLIFESGARRVNHLGISVKVWSTRRPAL
jgi:predicted ArsR family transcriptional regulator